MLDTDAINDNLRSIIRTALGIADVNYMRPANQNANTGDLSQPFGTVLLTEIKPVGVDANLYDDLGVVGELQETVVGQRHLIASIQFFRTSAYQNASRLGSLLRKAYSVRLLNQAGIGLIRVGRATDLSQVIDALWEQRAQMEIELYVTSAEQSTVATLATIPIVIETDQATTTEEVNLDVNS